ncbi:ABC transporter substrate-binding protein [Desulforegula conservatrix]|uniref:ABC transporter substrate-binding protein n=1 Tax=Desulforegula conservatrix TaxID=153026 RepID=UPI00041568E9|nr:ABC transporter substrate-binding protein [Desulforegula conservatrix]
MLKKYVYFVLFLLLPSIVSGREITDMAGRKISVPEKISRVYGVSPPVTNLIYSIDPNLIAALNSPVINEEKTMLRPEYKNLPVAGGIFGQGRSLNMETIIGLKPDLVIFWALKDGGVNSQYAEKMKDAGIPSVFLDLDRLEAYPKAYRFLGDILGRKERCEALASYSEESMKSVAAAVSGIPEKERTTVYYAEGTDGLSTERSSSLHAELIFLAGGRNVHQGDAPDHYGMEKISLEQVMLYDPEVILVQEKAFFDSVFSDKRWQSVKAVKNKRVYLIPRSPFNWFDRPPSFMRALGLKWLANILYPSRYPIDPAAETKKFYGIYLGMELKDTQTREILGL